MYYKQLSSSGQLITIGTTLDSATLPQNFVQISKSEYDRFQRVFSIVVDTPELTPLSNKKELTFNY